LRHAAARAELGLAESGRVPAGATLTSGQKMRFCFVSTRRGSYFMTELLTAIAKATADSGHSAELVFDEFPQLDREAVYVVIPHEFHAWGNPRGFPDARQRARTIALCTENPGTEWFEATYRLVAEFALAMSINRSSAAELGRRGIRCEHIQLGYSPLWDSWLRDEEAERDIDMLYLGAADPRRDPLIAGLGKDLSARECQLLIPPLEPRIRSRPDFLKGEEKYRRLRSARVLLNLHRTTSSALEWMRFLEAICNGCVVVSEPCLDNEPLVPGEHFLVAGTESIAGVVNGLLDDPGRLRALREQAYDFVRTKLPISDAADQLAELATELPRQPPLRGDSLFSVDAPATPAPSTEAQVGRVSRAQPTKAPMSRRLLRAFSDRFSLGSRDSGVQVIAQTAAYAQNTPRISVVTVIVPGREREGVEALASVAASHYGALEVLVDASGGADPAVGRFLNEYPALPAMLLCQSVSHGLGHARNALAKRARGEYLFILDADGGIYPSTLERLIRALDADWRAVFSYPMVAAFDGERPAELLSTLPWEPERLKRGNWIDATALIRRRRLLELGGYSTDPRLAGWEDFYLWCRCAEAGARGVHVPQVLGWRRQTANSETPAKWTLMRELFPELLGSADRA
jgi:Glycosyl transferase family 2/Glycosyl transferases group 1